MVSDLMSKIILLCANGAVLISWEYFLPINNFFLVVMSPFSPSSYTPLNLFMSFLYVQGCSAKLTPQLSVVENSILPFLGGN